MNGQPTQVRRPWRAVARTIFQAAVGFAALIFVLEQPLIAVFTNVPEVRAAADAFFFWAALLPLVGLGLLPAFIQRPIEIAADGVLFLRPVETNNRDMGIALFVDTE